MGFFAFKTKGYAQVQGLCEGLLKKELYLEAFQTNSWNTGTKFIQTLFHNYVIATSFNALWVNISTLPLDAIYSICWCF